MKSQRRRLIASAAAIVLVTTLGASQATANFKGQNGLIAFDSWTGTSQDIGVFDPEGTEPPTMLTTTASFSEHAPRWSRDGRKIVYMGHPQFGLDDQRSLQDIFVMDADGQHKTRLTRTPYQEEVPAWTAHGRIVFCGQSPTDPDNWDIYVMDADGTDLENLTDTGPDTFECWPSPAPHGDEIAFTRATEAGIEIWTMRLDGTGLRRVGEGRTSDWSPRGNDLVYAGDSGGGDRDVWMSHVDGTGQRQLTDTPARRELFPSFSPDGSKIVYGAIVASGEINIFSLDLATGKEDVLLEDAPPTTYSVAYPTWQPLPRGEESTEPRPNLALAGSVTASSEYGGNPASLANDGDWWSYWTSGDFPPGWIEVDLGSVEQIGEVALGITQLPDCATTHRLLGRKTASQPYTLLREFSGFTDDQQILPYVADAPKALRYIRVETTSSCSWVGWREIEVYAAREDDD